MKALKIAGIGLIVLIMGATVIANHKLIRRSDEAIAKADEIIREYEESIPEWEEYREIYEEITVQETFEEVETTERETDEDSNVDDSVTVWTDGADDDGNGGAGADDSEETEQERETEIYTFTEEEIWEMTRVVYLENGIVEESTDTTLYLTACVILNRLYDWDECSTIAEVIWENGQYSTANRYTDYNGADLGTSNPDGWARSYDAVCRAIECTDRNPHFQSTFAQGTVYYTDPNTGEVFCY